jgi:DNA-binding response OmpR family regulator
MLGPRSLTSTRNSPSEQAEQRVTRCPSGPYFTALSTRARIACSTRAGFTLTKPFVFEELLTRVRALTRRLGQAECVLIHTDGLTIDLRSRHAWRGDEKIELTSREFALLEYFMRHGGQVLSRQQILSAIWDYDFEPASNVVDV